ncbi:hypothetical protein NA57DRAFT_28830, partial [Rhizodiscina lignyota]
TSRSQIRHEIATQTLAKKNNWLLHNKALFLPLLPDDNHIRKLETLMERSELSGQEVPHGDINQQPEGITATLKDYQLTGLSYMVYLHDNGTSGMLGDEMGLGKTLQTLSLFQHLEERRERTSAEKEGDEIRPYLVVCPLSVVSSWMAEAAKWAPKLNALRFHGAAHERAMLKKIAVGQMDRFGNASVKIRGAKGKRAITANSFASSSEGGPYRLIITSYDTFAAEKAWFRQAFVWKYVVLDEGHKIKNSLAQVSAALQGIKAEHRLILTGTPLQNNMLEMWALLHWLYPDVFTDRTSELFKTSFDLTKGQVRTDVMDHARRLLELICLRRMKDSPTVNLGLPPKEEVLLYVPLTPMQRFWYTRMLTKAGDGLLNEVFHNAGLKEQSVLRAEAAELAVGTDNDQRAEASTSTDNQWAETKQILQDALEQEQNDVSTKDLWRRLQNLVMQLRQICVHPYLLPNVAPEPYFLGEHIVMASGKFVVLHKLLQDLVLQRKKKVLVFSGFTKTLDLAEDLLALLGGDGSSFKYSRFDGGTSRARRNLSIRMFNQMPEYQVMLISTRAGGLGINCQTASEVIFLDEDWNPQITLQAEARAHRIGQTQPVTMYKLCTQGTVEEQMLGRIRKKLYLSTKITESMRNVHSSPTKGRKGKGPGTSTDDMPQMDTGTLKSLIRRGAQTLSHANIDPTEMLSWDVETILDKCRDKPSDTSLDASSAGETVPEADEKEWLAMMERVECAVFEGKQVHRETWKESPLLPEDISREDRRRDKNTTVMVDGYAVNKESLLCGDWEAVPTLAGKDPRLADRVRAKRPLINSQEYCQVCWDGGELVLCASCPRSYHHDCLSDEAKAKMKGISFYCPQHNCYDCGKNNANAGGMLYRCRWCSHAYCEDCFDFDGSTLLGNNLIEYETLGYDENATAFYVECAPCLAHHREDKDMAMFIE